MDVLELALALFYHLTLKKYFSPEVVHFLFIVEDMQLLLGLELFGEEHVLGLPFDELPLGAPVFVEYSVLEAY